MKVNWLTKKMNQAGLMIKKNSPELLLAAGIVTFAGTVIMACRSTLKAREVLNEHKKMIDDIHEAKEIGDVSQADLEYDDDLYRKDLAVAYLKTGVSMAKLYLPAVALAGLSVTCFLTSKNILNGRYLGAVAAYNGVTEAFQTYRSRVVAEEGSEKDRHYRFGSEIKKDFCIVDENGKTEKVKVEDFKEPMRVNDDTARFFDESNPNWDKNPSLSMMFLRGQQNYLNDLYHERGHLFLNEVYDALGFSHTPQGAILGWLDDGNGDGCVDFGLYNMNNDAVRQFVNGNKNVILLEFNHDGIIFDKV